MYPAVAAGGSTSIGAAIGSTLRVLQFAVALPPLQLVKTAVKIKRLTEATASLVSALPIRLQVFAIQVGGTTDAQVTAVFGQPPLTC